MKKLQLLGDITPAQFLRDYWHKKPLLIRGAIPGFKPLLQFEQLAELARLNHVESRLVTQRDGQWNMDHGPLAELPPRTEPNWTMLVQGVNLHDERADALRGDLAGLRHDLAAAQYALNSAFARMQRLSSVLGHEAEDAYTSSTA